MANAGHLFIINGDIRRLACDAWLLPTDQNFSITGAFSAAAGMRRPGRLTQAPASWAGEGCLYLEALNSPGKPDLWIGDIGRSGDDLDHYAIRAEEFIRKAAERARKTTELDRAPLIALNVLGSGKGGQRSRRGALLEALIPAIQTAAVANSCDVVLVAYGSVMYSAAQAARRRLEPSVAACWSGLPERLREVGDDLAAKARSGDLVVFMGAGVSVAAGLPVWRPFLQKVGADLGLSDADLSAITSLDPRDQATILRNHDAAGFDVAVQKAMSAERPSLMHGLLASLPVHEFVTTNFDTLFESAALIADRELAVLPGQDPNSSNRWLLKLHGTLGSDLVLTRDEYLGAASRHVALRGLVQALLMTRQMLFVGYSLSDEDFHQLVHEVRSALGERNRPFGHALMPRPHPLIHRLWSDVEIVDTSEPGETPKHEAERPVSLEKAARRMAILLDYIGSRSASEVRYVADDSLGSLLTEHEGRLAALVEQLDALYDDLPSDTRDANGWDEVRKFLEHFAPETS